MPYGSPPLELGAQRCLPEPEVVPRQLATEDILQRSEIGQPERSTSFNLVHGGLGELSRLAPKAAFDDLFGDSNSVFLDQNFHESPSFSANFYAVFANEPEIPLRINGP
jgi:hypothetical protein